MWNFPTTPRPNQAPQQQKTRDPWSVAAQKTSPPSQPINYMAITSSGPQQVVQPLQQPIDNYWGVAAAAVHSQTTNAISTLIHDLSSGSGNRPPKLMDMKEYNTWKTKFKIHVEGQGLEGAEAWKMIVKGYVAPILENTGEPIPLENLADDEKKRFAIEKKAFSQLSQAINTDLLHQFGSCTTSKQLWDVLRNRHDGNEKTRKLRMEELRKEFENFSYMGNETLKELVPRYCHLLTELSSYEISIPMSELVDKFADALPPYWNQHIEVLKEKDAYQYWTINEFIQKLENKEMEEKRKAKRAQIPQNPDLYVSGTSTSLSTSSSTSSVAPHIACVSNVVEPTKAPINYLAQTSSYTPQSYQTPNFIPPFSPMQQAACYTASQPQQLPYNPHMNQMQITQTQSNQSPIVLETSNLNNVTVEIAQQHVALVSAMVASYNGLVASQIGNNNLTNEDYAQIDKEEMDLMDIQWAFASIMRIATNFI